MRRFWKSPSEARLVSRLESRRRRARPDFVHALAEEIRPSARRRFAVTRALVASALTLAMLVAVASVGGAGAAISNQLSAVVHSVNNTVTAGNTAGRSANDDDDDDDGGSGGGGDDDDDDGGDDDDGDDDQYEEERRECRTALYEAHRIFHRRPRLQNVSHQALHHQLEEAHGRCSSIGR